MKLMKGTSKSIKNFIQGWSWYCDKSISLMNIAKIRHCLKGTSKSIKNVYPTEWPIRFSFIYFPVESQKQTRGRDKYQSLGTAQIVRLSFEGKAAWPHSLLEINNKIINISRYIRAERVPYMACRLTSDISTKEFHLYCRFISDYLV